MPKSRPGGIVAEGMAGVTLTNEQFQMLLAQVSLSAGSVERNSCAPPVTSGNFVKCTAQFCGGAANDLEAFLEAVITYKDCANVSDENALRGLSILLEGTAATWWQGVKGVDSLRNAFSRKLPPHLVFREIFSREQRNDEASDLLVCHIRGLFAQLPYALPERVQLDMNYGLLHRKIRKRITASETDSFATLLRRCRDVELSQREKTADVVTQRAPVNSGSTGGRRPRCSFCRNFGHSTEECWKARSERVL
ncbi:hypothetical protein J437_LFUL009990 [Ladona fulva]|uniref:Uncharacterized protein n=1 Tax=Ladona fulva TaxID=123851 RepID=A0A8K0KGG7_LADFU|nr:hypothetical protein J437_LFUL009990 [Ladona fulva]